VVRLLQGRRGSPLGWAVGEVGCLDGNGVALADSVRSSEDTLALLRAHKRELVDRFGIVGLALFGSSVRDEARATSDVDILVKFEGRADSKRYFGVQFYLEDLLGKPVDLVTDKALRSELRPYVEAEAVHV